MSEAPTQTIPSPAQPMAPGRVPRARLRSVPSNGQIPAGVAQALAPAAPEPEGAVMSAEAVRLTAGLSGPQKAAILLLQLGEEESAKVLSRLTNNEIEEISAEIARMDDVPHDVVEAVEEEFAQIVAVGTAATRGGLERAKTLLRSSLGKERAEEILSRLAGSVIEVPFAFLQHAEPRQVLSFLREEHPQTVALVLAHVPSGLASQVLAEFDPELQTDVAHRIAVMNRTSPEIIHQVEAVLERKFSSVLAPTDLTSVGGLQPLIDIINRADRTTEKKILDGLDKIDPDLAEQIRSQMFTFDDIVGLEDRAMQLVLRDIDKADLAVAMKGVTPPVRDKILKNMSERAAESLQEDIDDLGPVRLHTVEEAQTKIVGVIRKLEDAGRIVIRRGDDDEFIA